MFQTKVVEKIKTHILYSVFLFFENRAVFEIMLKNILEPERTQVIGPLSVAYWISKATRAQEHTHTHTEKCVILIAFSHNGGFVNAPQYYVTCKLPVLLVKCLIGL
jgi:hypothetical protein